jgi:DNA topoisomerase IA
VLTSPELTGAWEKRLVEMERGAERREVFMRDVVTLASEIVEFLRELPPERTRFPRGATSRSSVPAAARAR